MSFLRSWQRLVQRATDENNYLSTKDQERIILCLSVSIVSHTKHAATISHHLCWQGAVSTFTVTWSGLTSEQHLAWRWSSGRRCWHCWRNLLEHLLAYNPKPSLELVPLHCFNASAQFCQRTHVSPMRAYLTFEQCQCQFKDVEYKTNVLVRLQWRNWKHYSAVKFLHTFR